MTGFGDVDMTGLRDIQSRVLVYIAQHHRKHETRLDFILKISVLLISYAK